MKTTAALVLFSALPGVMNALSIEDVSTYLRGETNDFENGKWERTLQSSGYVQIIFPSGISSSFSSAFTNAATFWNNVLGTSPVTPLTFTSAFNVRTSLPGCGVTFTFPAGTVINGLAIFAVVSPIDGVGSILGQAGPCGFTGNFPRIGSMTFDSADVQQLLNNGQLGEVIRHEMGHVIGIGGRWSAFGLVQNPCTSTPCNTNPTYRGVNGKAGFAQLGGGTGNVPVSNEGGAGTFNAHWRESTFGNELMTGFLNAGVSNPMSIMTVRSLIDLGYNVNLASAQTYSIPRPEDITTGEIEMVGDILETTPVDIEAVLESIEQTNAQNEKNGELTVFIGVVAALMALLVAFVVLVAYKIKRSNETAIQEMKNMHLQAQVESFTPPPTRASKKDVSVPVAEE